MVIFLSDQSLEDEAVKLSKKTGAALITESDKIPEDIPTVIFGEAGVVLSNGRMQIKGDFVSMLSRLNEHNLNRELLVRAAGIKAGRIENEKMPYVIDATAGLGQDSLLLAAAGCRVDMYENDPVIAALLADCLRRAKKKERLSTFAHRAKEELQLSDIVERMTVIEKDSIAALRQIKDQNLETPNIVYLDPMFPERTKTGLVKKKFQLLHILEKPCANEEELLEAAIEAKPGKIIIKRPLKGNILAGHKPSYSIKGKSVRYDCIVL